MPSRPLPSAQQLELYLQTDRRNLNHPRVLATLERLRATLTPATEVAMK